MNIRRGLLEELAELLQRSPDDAALQRAQWHLLDWLGCAVLGAGTPVAEKIHRSLDRFARFNGGDGACSVNGERYGWQDALWFNAAVGNTLEMDDVHRTSTLHPGPVVIPAALAVAELVNASPQQLLRAIVVGYEAMIRIGRSLGRGHYRFYHNTSTCGAFGAAAAAASLLQLDSTQWAWALGNAGTRTGGLWQMRHEATDSKQLHNAEAARSGVMAAMLASENFRGPAHLLEGPQGLYAATSEDSRADMVLAGPAGPWLIFECSFKPWPACRHTHATIDATIVALSDALNEAVRHNICGPVALSELREIEVATYADALTFCDRPEPADSLQARFSLQHCVAVCVLEGKPGLAHFEGDWLHRDDIAQLRRRVNVVEDAEISARYPEYFGARVTLHFANGTRKSCDVSDAWGDPERPLSEADVIQKAVSLMTATGAADDLAASMCKSTLELSEAGDLRPWLDQLRLLVKSCRPVAVG